MTITRSPYYRSGKNSLPSGDTVKAGGLYFADDHGNAVNQIYTSSPAPYSTSSKIPTTINLSETGQAEYQVKGYAQQLGGFTKSPTWLTMNITVSKQPSNGVKLDQTQLANTLQLKFGNKIGYLFNVPSTGEQLRLEHHIPYPELSPNGKSLETQGGGNLYLLLDGSIYPCAVAKYGMKFEVNLSTVDEASEFADPELVKQWHEAYGP